MKHLRLWDSPLVLAIGTGVVVCLLTLLVHLRLASFEYGIGLGFVTWPWPGAWIVGGTLLFGAVPAYVSARYRLITPVLVAIGIYAWAFATSWSSMIDSAQSSGAGLTPTIFEIGLGLWPIVLWIPLIVGAFEYGIRRVMFGGRFTATT